MFNQFLKSAFKQTAEVVPSVTIVIDGVSISAAYSAETHYGDNEMGGFEPDNGMSITAATADLPATIRDKVHEVVTIDGNPWRIEKVDYGQIITNLVLISKNAS